MGYGIQHWRITWNEDVMAGGQLLALFLLVTIHCISIASVARDFALG